MSSGLAAGWCPGKRGSRAGWEAAQKTEQGAPEPPCNDVCLPQPWCCAAGPACGLHLVGWILPMQGVKGWVCQVELTALFSVPRGVVHLWACSVVSCQGKLQAMVLMAALSSCSHPWGGCRAHGEAGRDGRNVGRGILPRGKSNLNVEDGARLKNPQLVSVHGA